MSLCWTDIEDVAEALEMEHPEADIMSVRFSELRSWVLELEDFNDDPNRCNERILQAIQETWYDIRMEGGLEEDEDDD